MDILKIQYEKLCATEVAIRLELNKQRARFMKPREEVAQWLRRVESVHNRVKGIEKSFLERRSTEDMVFSISVRETTKAVDTLLEQSQFANGLVVSDRSQLWPVPTIVGTSARETMDQIWANFTNPAIGVIGVYGLGGVGKTTIMMNIKNSLAKSHIFNKVIWVTVSKEYNLAEVQKDIALQLNMDLKVTEADDVERRSFRLNERLRKTKKFVIIFDDLWDIISLRDVGIDNRSKDDGSKIVLISRSMDICDRMGADKIVRVEVLSPQEAWDLFVDKAGNIALTQDIEPFARRVAQKCCRVPIVLTSVGLAMKDEVSVKVWRQALVELSTPVARPDGIVLSTPVEKPHDIVLDLLRYVYSRLGNRDLQNCFLYCACFPEDYLFKPDELIRYWIAEGFINVNGDITMEIEDGFRILTKLLDANMLEMITKGGDDWLTMHDLFRDLAIKVMKEEPRVWVKASPQSQKESYNWQWSDTRKISLMRSKIKSLDILPTSCRQVSSLLLHQNPVSYIHPSFFTPMLQLEFLDISYSLITELPPSLSDLVQLRALFLHYCTSLTAIPPLEKMKNLQFLSVCGTSIAELPYGIEGLVNLRSFDLSDTKNLANIEAGVISSLTRLEELRLQGSGLCKMDSPMVANYLLEMKCLKHLAILTITNVGYENLLGTILHLKQHNLKIYSVNLYGSTEDYNEDIETTDGDSDTSVD